MDSYLSTIMGWGPTWAPRGWSLCQGQLIAISQFTAVFSLIGTIYGGDGRTTFALPDLRGRVAIQQGLGPGLSDRRLGQKGGQENHTLVQSEMPSHTHTARATASNASISGNVTATMNTNTSADSDSADGTFLANNSGGDGFASDAGNTTLNSAAISVNTS
ncbi:tail fiber protein, partial [uncultured Algoriphagus sp.]|uniref:phage tail protein n=1 Tax=uncultured Algoriphagus sp. TaxID=417365 RepID=UPI0025932478